jgi:hypothetical protein
VALGALGILLGLSLPIRAGTGLSTMAGGAQASLTIGLVGLGLFGAVWLVGSSMTGPVWFLPLFASLCAAASLTLPGRQATGPRRLDEAVIEWEVAVMIAAGGVVVASARTGSFVAGALLFAQACGVAAMLATAGWLLVRETAGIIETRVFAFATLLLVGGAADYLSFSSLLGGLAAGLLWQVMGGVSCERLQRETLYAQHPFVVLVLVVAGARTDLSTLVIALGAAYASVRSIARLLGASVLWRQLSGLRPSFRLRLIDPGIFGVAFGLNLGRALGSDAATTLSVVAIGTILSDITLGLVSPRRNAE